MNSGKGFCFADVQALVPGIAQRHPALKHLRSLGETQAPASGAASTPSACVNRTPSLPSHSARAGPASARNTGSQT